MIKAPHYPYSIYDYSRRESLESIYRNTIIKRDFSIQEIQEIYGSHATEIGFLIIK